MKLKGRTAVVTGAGRGIGFAVARRLLQEGAAVLVCDVREDRLERALSLLKETGRVFGVLADVADEGDVERLFATADREFGRLDVLVNNAGIARLAPFVELSTAVWDETIRVNLRGAFLCARAAAQRMRRQRSGVMVHVSSTNGLRGEAEMAHYNASKAGIALLSKTIAVELGPYNVRSVAVCPGYILTELSREVGATDEFIREYVRKIPLGRYGTPEDVAAAVAFLCSDDAGFITGVELVIDGGQLAVQ